MSDIEVSFGSLVSYIDELSGKFIAGHIPADPQQSPSSYETDVKAYCVLSHAAFEEYIEKVALAVAADAVDRWMNTRRVGIVLLTLLTWNRSVLVIDDDEKLPEKKPSDYLTTLIDAAKSSYSKAVHNNHGVSILYLRNLLVPVAMETNYDVNLLNSLKKLADGRGAYAHKGKAKSFEAPEDAKRLVMDVVKLCGLIKDNAKALMA